MNKTKKHYKSTLQGVGKGGKSQTKKGGSAIEGLGLLTNPFVQVHRNLCQCGTVVETFGKKRAGGKFSTL